jgi:hypothetical protein
MQSEIALGFTLCKLVETELELGEIKQAHALLQKIRHSAATFRRHVDEPDFIPPHQFEEVRAEVARLESRLLALESRRE